MAKYTFVANGDFQSVTAFIDGDLLTVNNDHPRFDEILNRLRADDLDGISVLFNPVQEINDAFAKLSTQVSIRGNEILYKGSPVHSSLADMILSLYNQGDQRGYEAFAKFLEKLYQNPNEHSREMLFDWLQESSFTINSDGDFIGYKGVKAGADGYLSINSGDGIVDGKQYFNTCLPNNPGSVVEMPRDKVTFDPNNGCSFGLHVGTWAYASGFGKIVLEVTVNPRDVVSVPTHEHAKLRCCRYQVVQVVEKKYDEAFIGASDDDIDIDYCDDCGTDLDYCDCYASDDDDTCDCCSSVDDDCECDEECFGESDEDEPDYSGIVYADQPGYERTKSVDADDNVASGQKLSFLRDYPGMNGISMFRNTDADDGTGSWKAF